MKEGTSLTTLIGVLVAFTLIFAAFLCLAIVYNKAYRLKNESITILEKYEGATTKALNIVNNYLSNSGYNTKGSCGVGEYGNTDLSNSTLELVSSSDRKYYYCLSETCTKGNCNLIDNDNKIYFKFKLFFKFNLPYFSDLLVFTVSGETKKIKFFDLDQRLA